jgi:hypothetical protein
MEIESYREGTPTIGVVLCWGSNIGTIDFYYVLLLLLPQLQELLDEVQNGSGMARGANPLCLSPELLTVFILPTMACTGEV